MEKLKRLFKYLAVFFIILLVVYYNSCEITYTTYLLAMIGCIGVNLIDLYFPSVCNCYMEK